MINRRVRTVHHCQIRNEHVTLTSRGPELGPGRSREIEPVTDKLLSSEL